MKVCIIKAKNANSKIRIPTHINTAGGSKMYNAYSHRKRKPTGLIITIIVCLTIVGFTIFFAYRYLSVPIPRQTAEEEVPQGDIVINREAKKDIKYNENASFNLTTSYRCGHTEVTEEKIPSSFIGKTIEEIKAKNKEYDIYTYNDFSISANKTLDRECGNHYIIKLEGNKLKSYNKQTPDITEKEITINLREFFEEDIEILKNGIEVGSKTELLEFYEDFA